MNRVWTAVACLGFLAGSAWIVAADQPAMPPGHPVISKDAGAGAGGDAKPAMPAGHPDVSQMPRAGAGELPAGHPKMPGAEAQGAALPAGHPTMESLRAAATQTGPGSLSIRGVQGTKGGPAIAGDAVVVEIYGEGSKLLKTVQAKLDAKGETSVEIPLDVICQPVVRITHGGVAYEGIGKVMDRGHASQQIEMTLAETTEKQPAWEVKMRHVLVHVAPEGLHVTEMLSIVSPGDQTWIGTEAAGKRTTVSVQLPAGARDLNTAGVPEGALEIRDGKLVSAMPLMPGATEFQLEYVVPSTDGKADLTITAPAPVTQMYVFIPDDGSTVTTAALDSMGTRKTGEGSKRAYKAANLKAGQEAKLSFSGLKAPAAAEPMKKSDAGTSHLPQVAAGVGGGLILIGGVTFVLLKAPRKGESQG